MVQDGNPIIHQLALLLRNRVSKMGFSFRFLIETSVARMILLARYQCFVPVELFHIERGFYSRTEI
jgi:hypothetical protein